MVKKIVLFCIGGFLGLFVAFVYAVVNFEKTYTDRAFPGVYAGNLLVAGKTHEEIALLFQKKNEVLATTHITLEVENHVASLSGVSLALSFDEKQIATDSLAIGRSGEREADSLFKLASLLWSLRIRQNGPLAVVSGEQPSFETTTIEETITSLATYVDIRPVEPLFEFDSSTNRVTTFKLGSAGRKLNQDQIREAIHRSIREHPGEQMVLRFVPEQVPPKAKTEDIDNLGITELIGRGESYFKGSIAGRIHNILLAASRTSGVLIGPDETYSFNRTVGDISAATGYQSAYIIKNGRTILGDGGGVCQVSTTVFRAALNAGLEISERKAHAYRVGYYEQGGYKPGLDATVYDPLVDLQIKNNTGHHILLQAKPEPNQNKLSFEIYGHADGRVATISAVRVWDQTAPPPPVYQDDPTLAPGVVKQVDWEAWGAKAAFDYTVTRGSEELAKKTFVSNFRPWQAVFLRGVTQ